MTTTEDVADVVTTEADLETPERDAQRRVIRVLLAAQVLGGIGVAAGIAVAALLMADLASDALSGVASSATVIGAALIAIPVSRVMHVRGRRPGLVLAYLVGLGGALVVVAGARADSFPIALAGMIAVGGGTTATLQSRYAATDLASASSRGRALSTVVWATTVGSVVGPNLVGPMGSVASGIGVPALAGPFLLTATAYALAAVTIALLLRPDPLLAARAARRRDTDDDAARSSDSSSLRNALELIWARPAALLGLAAVVLGHAVMVAVMSMTPVHLQHGGASLEVVGLVVSVHIAGMYAASPLVGIAADRYGRHAVIMTGGLLLLASFVISGTASSHASTQLGIGLTMLGLGWSCSLIAGSTLLTESIPVNARPNVQGTADLVMGIGGASAGLLAGVVVGFGSYALLTAFTAAMIVPLVIVTASRRPSFSST